jgi:hypothetical protein
MSVISLRRQQRVESELKALTFREPCPFWMIVVDNCLDGLLEETEVGGRVCNLVALRGGDFCGLSFGYLRIVGALRGHLGAWRGTGSERFSAHMNNHVI